MAINGRASLALRGRDSPRLAILVDDERGTGACGDWCLGSNIEAAFRSGQAMAETILALYGITVALGAS